MALSEVISVEEMRRLVLNENKTHQDVSSYLKEKYPGKRGLSVISIRRFCIENEIRKRTNLSKEDIKKEVFQCVSQVGGNYGRRMMTGYMRSKGIHVAEKTIGVALREISPSAQRARAVNAGRSLNPKVYKADYFGHKLHVDQNEKLVMYGVTHVCARDGYSGMIVSYTTMPVKNNCLIYENIYRSAIESYGIWDQLRLDGGKEFVLITFVQELLMDLRRNTAREPWMRTKSTDNNIIERIWVEVNTRVNYPIKSYMNDLVQSGVINMSDEVTKFCVSWVLCRVSNYGLRLFVDAWNHHSVPKKGKPIHLAQNKNYAAPVPVARIPDTDGAVDHYKQLKGTIKLFPTFGIDPLSEFIELQEVRKNRYFEKFQSNEEIFTDVLKNGCKLKEAILYFIQLSYEIE